MSAADLGMPGLVLSATDDARECDLQDAVACLLDSAIVVGETALQADSGDRDALDYAAITLTKLAYAIFDAARLVRARP